MYIGNRNSVTVHSLTDKGSNLLQLLEDETGQPGTRRKQHIFKQKDN